MEQGLSLVKGEGTGAHQYQYQEAIGSLLYYAGACRPDILKGTEDMELVY